MHAMVRGSFLLLIVTLVGSELAAASQQRVAYHCEVAPETRAALLPQGDGPARLREVYCHGLGLTGFGGSLLAVSPDGQRIARLYYPGELRVSQLAVQPSSTSWAATVATLNNEAAPIWIGSDALWGGLQERLRQGGWPTSPVRLVRISAKGVAEIPKLQGAPGRLDAVHWLGDEFLLAEFDTKGEYYRPERKNPKPTLAMVDLRRSRILDVIRYADVRSLDRQASTHSSAPVGALLPDGRLRVVISGQNWIVWTQGEAPHLLPNPHRVGVASITPDGQGLLVSSLVAASGAICEHNPKCPPPVPQEGVWAELRDISSGTVLWTIHGRAENFTGSRPDAVIRSDGRYGLLHLAPGKVGSELALIAMEDGAILQRFSPHIRGYGFTQGGRTLWIEDGGVIAFYSLS